MRQITLLTIINYSYTLTDKDIPQPKMIQYHSNIIVFTIEKLLV